MKTGARVSPWRWNTCCFSHLLGERQLLEGDKVWHFTESVSEYDGVPFRAGQAGNKVQGDVGPWAVRNGQRLKKAHQGLAGGSGPAAGVAGCRECRHGCSSGHLPPDRATKTFAGALCVSIGPQDDRRAMTCGPTPTPRPSCSLGRTVFYLDMNWVPAAWLQQHGPSPPRPGSGR